LTYADRRTGAAEGLEADDGKLARHGQKLGRRSHIQKSDERSWNVYENKGAVASCPLNLRTATDSALAGGWEHENDFFFDCCSAGRAYRGANSGP
jgi:hypothetical protein